MIRIIPVYYYYDYNNNNKHKHKWILKVFFVTIK